jgi:hypothetical protein
VFEICLVSSMMVLTQHVLIPLYIFSDVKRVKQRVIRDIVLFKNKIKRSLVKQSSVSVAKKFNAAEFFFVSSRVAQSHPEFPESAMISEYRTIWPKKSFRPDNSQVKSSYDMRFTFISQAVSRVALFGLTSLIQVPEPIRELSLRLFVTGGLGYMILLFHRLSKISPFLLILPVVVILVVLYTFFLNGNSRLGLSKTHPIEDESPPEDMEEEGDEGKDGDVPQSSCPRDKPAAAVHESSPIEIRNNEPVVQQNYRDLSEATMDGLRLAGRMVDQLENLHQVPSNPPDHPVPIISSEVESSISQYWIDDSNPESSRNNSESIIWEDSSSEPVELSLAERINYYWES